MSYDAAIKIENLSKAFQVYETPRDRLKQFIFPKLQHLTGQPNKQYFREFPALNNISFEVKKGETIGIVGRNGSGKSTLLQLICGILSPSTGTVTTNGRIAALLELGSGFNPDFTGRENVYMNAAVLGLTKQETDVRFSSIEAFASIGDFIDQPVKTYSSGMQLRLAFAVSVSVDPEILIVDEALAVGDEAFQRKCFARIETIKKNGGTILFVNHGPQAIIQLSDRAILMDRGEIIASGRPKNIVNQYQRLINASTTESENIRNQILSASMTENTSKKTHKLQESPEENPEIANKKPENLSTSQDIYDPNLSSQSITSLEERGASIRDVRITSINGEPVNILTMGKRYIYEYVVDFSKDAHNIGFGCGVRTISGLMLAGATTSISQKQRLSFISKGQIKKVRFEFTCNLLPGIYFWQCGVRGFINSEEIYMHRILDAICFRVLPEEDSILTGHFDLSINAQII